jgi:plastocyanin
MLLVAALTLAACGDDDGNGDTTAAPIEEGAEEAGSAAEEGAEEAESAAEEGANELAPSGEAVRSEKVEIVEFTYQPDPVTIQAGGKVTWINRDSAPHTATADDGSFDTGDLAEGKLKSETFKEAGEYPYFCEIHPEMHGTVEVVAAG